MTRSPWLRALDLTHSCCRRYVNVNDLPTPALVADLDVLERNMTVMTQSMHGRRVGLRPHVKCRKAPTSRCSRCRQAPSE
jgi:D-serine deaminase-like pyridoxal phosphate-dependent protein